MKLQWVWHESEFGVVDDARFEDLWLPRVGPTGVAALRMVHRLVKEANWLPELDVEWADFAASCGVSGAIMERTFRRLHMIGHFTDRLDDGWVVKLTYDLPRPASKRAFTVLEQVAPWLTSMPYCGACGRQHDPVGCELAEVTA